jgi:hypothetical protein
MIRIRGFSSAFLAYAVAPLLDHWKSVPSHHMRCKITASFRATATLAFFKPPRFASLSPQALSEHHFGTRVNSTPAASNK